MGSATATVQAVLQVTADQALAFGTVYQGVPKTVTATDDANSGIFTVTDACRYFAEYLRAHFGTSQEG